MKAWLNPDHWQLPVTFALIWVFARWEQARPLSPTLERRRDLPQDLLALVVVLSSSLLAQAAFRAIFTQPAVQALFRGLEASREWPMLLRLGLATLGIDLALYGIHRLLHHRYFWRIHVWHHSTRELYWFSGYRTSAIQAALFFLPSAFVSLALLRFTPLEFLALTAIAAFFQLINHANVRTGWTRLGKWIVTPEYHRLHHDRGEIRDKNFGAIFTHCDRIFGTYLDPALYPEARPVGLDDYRGAKLRTIVGL